MGQIMLIRHGRTPGNSSGRFIGQYNEPLNELGVKQAELLVPVLTRFKPDRVFSSDLQRCTQTMVPFAQASGTAVETDPRLREVGDGEWTYKTMEELWEGWPDLMDRYRKGEDVPRPGGERWSEVRSRVLSGLKDIIGDMGSEDRVAICTHAGPLLLISAWVTGVELPGNIFLGPFQPPENGSVTTIDPHRPALIGYGETCHLLAVADAGPDGYQKLE